MSTNSQDQEIDLGQVFKKIGDFYQLILDKIFDLILFLKRNIIVIIVLFILGAGLGYYLDKDSKIYDHEIIVLPNFGSTDYLYSKVNLLESKRKEKDTSFLNKLGFIDKNDFKKIEIEPIIDVYQFIDSKESNFGLIKLMAEDGDLQKIIKDDVTSKNYPFHVIKIKTASIITSDKIKTSILKYLNDSDYFKVIQNQSIENLKSKIVANDETVIQIDNLLNDFAKTSSSNQKSDKLVYYNENNQLNDIIKTKEELIKEQGYNKINLVNSDKIIKDINISINSRNTDGLSGKNKLILPFLFLLIFIFVSNFIRFYKRQTNKKKNI
ncbi:hypothetical protein SY27_11365 [Flavobacterium sp. 316]|uniref:hypothetical protein n=1 Tax=Flavobacterium sp. 316 TaxID=1603293 RepID=UPI0005E92135|nr:hypothetical protein [Flavobacterium sp. 316]KIX20508.1 hypothetical protein SY27_11365 [Flavobacterium sp. 316]